MDQLDILKQEMAELKRNLDKEKIVNKQLLRTVMRQRASWLNKFVIAEFIMLPILYLMFVGICAFFQISQWYALTLLIFSLADAVIDMRTFRISPKVFSTCTMLEVGRLLKKQKKERFIQMCISLPLAIIWLVLTLSAIANGSDPLATDHALNLAGAIGGLAGGLIGGIIVLVIYRKAQRTNDTIISDIDDESKG
ncbi:MAG: hypothetical protein K2N25_03710 [Muribaculaceae bacterium]|nr:hypothetical protein [Muribaculaceae bacterium]